MPEIKVITRENMSNDDNEFDYQKELTTKLDKFSKDFDVSVINEITLWKVNRYVNNISKELLARLNEIRSWEKLDCDELKQVLDSLLKCHGVGLPMASTYLRFRNPKLFQIIDQRVYRVIFGEKLKLPGKLSQKGRDACVKIYLEYLEELESKSQELGIEFRNADRILFNADKRLNKKLSLGGYGYSYS